MKKPPHAQKSSAVHLGFQIAPMIDVVFVIMLFFMVVAGAVKVENAHTMQLPVIPADGPVPLPAEVFIRVDDDGQVYLNEDPLDSPDVSRLPELTGNLLQLRENSTATKSDLFVTIDAREHATYQRIVDVLDALHLAQIDKVSFVASALD